MARESVDLHLQLRDLGVDTGLRKDGLLDVYETERGFERGLRNANRHEAVGLRPEPLSAEQLMTVEPALVDGLRGGVLYPDEMHCDPLVFVRALGAAAEASGAHLLTRAEVLDISRDAKGAALVITTAGAVRAAAVVVAAGAWSAQLAQLLGDRIPLQAGKGYTVDLAAEDRPFPIRPMILQEARVAVTPLSGRLRLAGTMVFAGLDERIDRKRARAVERAGRRVLPRWRQAVVTETWSGLRPCVPDGLPLIGWLGRDQPIAIATGHAMLGLTLAPLTGRLVADLLDGRRSDLLTELDPGRFNRSS